MEEEYWWDTGENCSKIFRISPSAPAPRRRHTNVVGGEILISNPKVPPLFLRDWGGQEGQTSSTVISPRFQYSINKLKHCSPHSPRPGSPQRSREEEEFEAEPRRAEDTGEYRNRLVDTRKR